jgi:hypothetical protein
LPGLLRSWSPERFETLVAAATVTIIFIAEWVFDVIVLVVILRRIELGSGDNFRHDGLFETLGESFFGFLR